MEFFDKSEGVSRKEYLKNHDTHCFGYGCPPPRRYANNVKVYKLGLTSEQLDKAFKVINHDAFYDDCSIIINDSGMKNVYFGGRVDEYLHAKYDTRENYNGSFRAYNRGAYKYGAYDLYIEEV